MSKVLIVYNSEEISKKDKEKIANKFFHFFIDGFFKSVKYKKFGKLQLIYSNFSKNKQKLKISGDILVSVCGYILEEKRKCSAYNVENMEDLLIDLSKEPIKKIEEVICNFSGAFVVFLYNKKTDKVIIFNDKFGFYPAYLFWEKTSFIYSSSVEMILTFNQIPRIINHDAIFDFICIGSVQNQMTFISSINRLAGASLITRYKSKVIIKKYYKLVFGNNLSLEDNIDMANDRLIEAVLKICDMSDGNTIFELTGGFDTRLISSIAAENKINYSFFSLNQTGWKKNL